MKKITRTIKSTEIIAKVYDREEKVINAVSVVLTETPANKIEKAVVKAIGDQYGAKYTFIEIEDSKEIEKVYSMTVSKFIENAEVIN